MWKEPSTTWCLMEYACENVAQIWMEHNRALSSGHSSHGRAFIPSVLEERACLSHFWVADSWIIGLMPLCERQTVPSRILALGSNLNVKLKSCEFIKGFLWGWNMQ